MGIFSYFSQEAKLERRRASAQKRLSNMYYQSVERNAAAQEMAELAQQYEDNQALHILLTRFEHMNPSTTVDQDEKQYVVELLHGIGDVAIEGTKKYVHNTTEGIFWPMRFLKEKLPEEDFCAFLAKMLADTSDEYVRDPKKKLGLVQLAKEHPSPDVNKEVLRFVDDFDENVRFHAINVALECNIDGVQDALRKRWADPSEDSGRIWLQIAEAFMQNGWTVGDQGDAIREHLPPGISISAKGTIIR